MRTRSHWLGRVSFGAAFLFGAADLLAVPALAEKTLYVGGVANAAVTVPYKVVATVETDPGETPFQLVPAGNLPQVPVLAGTLNQQPAWAFSLSGLLPGTYSTTVTLRSADGLTEWDEFCLHVVVTDGGLPEEPQAQAAVSQAVANSLARTSFSNGTELINAVRARMNAMFGLNQNGFELFDPEIVAETVDRSLQEANTATPLTESEKAVVQQELDQVLADSFNHHDFGDVYLYGMLMQLADLHYAKGKYPAARELYAASLGYLPDMESMVFPPLYMSGRSRLLELGASATKAEILSALLAAKTDLNSHFTYFPGSTSRFALHSHRFPAAWYFGYFPRLLTYADYSFEAFDQALAEITAACQLKPTDPLLREALARVQAWRLGTLSLSVAAPDGSFTLGAFTIENTSPNTLYPNSDTRPDDIRNFVIPNGALEIPVFTGHGYRLYIMGKPVGADFYDYVYSELIPQPNLRITLVGGETTRETEAGPDSPAQIRFVYRADLFPQREPSLFIPADPAGGGVDYGFSIARHETRVEDLVQFLNARDLAGALEVGNGRVNSNGVVLCLTDAARADSPILYLAEAAAGSRFAASAAKKWHPAIFVTWFGAASYCNWRSLQDNLVPAYDAAHGWSLDANASGYRLPTEAEWKKAAAWNSQAGLFSLYGGGIDAISSEKANYLGSGDPWESEAIGTTPAVNYPFTESAFGVHDSAGNVWEWCQENDTATPCAFRVRGGSWGNLAYDLTTESYSAFKPEQALGTVGFRIVKR